MGDSETWKPQQGDEARLFAEFNDVLVRVVAKRVRTAPDIIEDACATAWTQFLRYQPDRQTNWQGWLFTTAQREAWRLHRARFKALAIDPAAARAGREWVVSDLSDPRDPLETHIALDAAIGILEQLPARLRRIAWLRASGMRYRDIGELTGDSQTRVSQLVARANLRIYEAIERSDPPARDLPPRARRLQALESAPPPWLVAEVGRPPRANQRKRPYASLLLAWRRAALAIDDYRTLTGFNAPDRGLGARPSSPAGGRAFDHAIRAVARARESPALDREIG